MNHFKGKQLKLITLLIIIVFLFTIFTYLNSKVIYVSNTGKNHYPGTNNKPIKSINKAINMALPGTTIKIKPGIYKETLHINKNGFPFLPIKVTGMYGKTKLIGNIDRSEKIINIRNSNYINISGLNLSNLKATNSEQTPTAINIDGHSKSIIIKNNIIHDIETDYKEGNSHGISAYGKGISNIQIVKNKLYNLKLGNSEALVLNGNIHNFKVSNNQIFDNNNIGIDIIGYEGIESNDKLDKARNGTISNNSVQNNTSKHNPSYNGDQSAAGIYIDGGENIVISDNISANNDIGIEIASEHKNKNAVNILVKKNIIKNNCYTGIAIGGYNQTMGGVKKIRLLNNRLIHNDQQQQFGGEILLQYNINDLIITKNAISPNKNGYLLIKDNKSGKNINIKHNNYNLKGSNKTIWNKKEEYLR